MSLDDKILNSMLGEPTDAKRVAVLVIGLVMALVHLVAGIALLAFGLWILGAMGLAVCALYSWETAKAVLWFMRRGDGKGKEEAGG